MVQHSEIPPDYCHPPKPHNQSADTITSGTLAIARGGTGQSTAQAAIDALTQVSGATNEHVLTKDTDTGNAKWKVSSGGGSSTWTGLTDTPSSITALQIVRGNSGGTALETIAQSTLLLDDFGTPGDNTDLNATTGHHGLLPKLGGGTTNYLRADGTWAEPSGSGSGLPVVDTTSIVTGSSDATKQMRFEVDGLTTSTTRVMTVPDKDITICDNADLTTHTGGANPHSGSAASGANSDITQLSGLTTDLSIAQGGTGQSTAQAAIDALSAVSGATNEHVLTKDTGTGNAKWKVATGSGVTDHGALTGLADDDHTQYLLANGTRSLVGNWNPDGNGTRKIGDSTHKLAEIWAVDGIFGDLVFEERECHICGKTFDEGDLLSLVVIKMAKNGTHTVPVHSTCVGGDN